MTDVSALEKIVDDIIAKNPDKVGDAKSNPKAIGWFVGQVMKASGGKANPQVVNELMREASRNLERILPCAGRRKGSLAVFAHHRNRREGWCRQCARAVGFGGPTPSVPRIGCTDSRVLLLPAAVNAVASAIGANFFPPRLICRPSDYSAFGNANEACSPCASATAAIK